MYIEIRKAGFINKGAELMLYAVLQKMQQAYPSAHFVMAPNNTQAPYNKRVKLGLYQKALGLYQKAWLSRGAQFGIQVGNLFELTPKILRRAYGIVLDKEIDIVLDAAGFSYSDQWGVSSCLELAHSSKRWKKRGTKVILLPQAFGPFKSSQIKQSIQTIVEHVDLIFARERVSYEHLLSVVGERENIKIAPDFTNLIEGYLPDNFDAKLNKFCIVPNYRMIDKTPLKESSAYLPFMIYCVSYLLKKGFKPFILLHEGNHGDVMLANQIRNAVGGHIPIVEESHPLKIKGILGVSEGVIGSRFHSLVSALSQGVPVLATGWSHKYEMLLQDYDFTEGLINVTAPQSEITQKIDSITETESREMIRQTIQERSLGLKRQSEDMWQQVFSCLTSVRIKH